METPLPIVLSDHHSRPFLVFARGRKLWHAVAVDTTISIVSLPSLAGLDPVLYKSKPYPPRRAASFWLNRDHRPITDRARAVLRGIVARKPRGDTDVHTADA